MQLIYFIEQNNNNNDTDDNDNDTVFKVKSVWWYKINIKHMLFKDIIIL